MRESFHGPDFWEHRHNELRGDHRNVGNRGLSSEQNLILIGSKAALIAHHLGVLGLGKGANVLDAGCGAGIFTSMLAPCGFQLFGNDVSATAIEDARETGCGKFAVASLAEIGFSIQFDAVLCLDVLFHVVDDEEWSASLLALLEATRPGGYLLIIEHFPDSGGPQATHCRWRTFEQYQTILSNCDWLRTADFRYPHENLPKTLLIARRANQIQV